RDPDDADVQSRLALFLATTLEPRYRDAGRAVELATKAANQKPDKGTYWSILGLAHYRAGDWKATITAIDKALKLQAGGDVLFVLAMAHWQQGNQPEARRWYKQAVQWMERYAGQVELLRRFRAEAAALLQIKDGPPETKP